MNGMNEPRGPEWLEQALNAWADAQPLNGARLDAISEAATREATPPLTSEWWRTIFPSFKAPSAA
jgi:hypothetical protein